MIKQKQRKSQLCKKKLIVLKLSHLMWIRLLTGVGSEIYRFTKEHRNYYTTNMQSAESFFTSGVKLLIYIKLGIYDE